MNIPNNNSVIPRSICVLSQCLVENTARVLPLELWDEVVANIVLQLRQKADSKSIGAIPDGCRFLGETAHQIKIQQKESRYIVVVHGE